MANRWITQIILVFWGCWFFIVFSTNLLNMLQMHSFIQDTVFSSNNFAQLTVLFAPLHLSTKAITGFFAVGIVIELGLAVLFWLAAVMCLTRVREAYIHLAAIASCIFWGVFILIDEICVGYNFAHSHMMYFMATMLSFVLIFKLIPAR